MGTAEVWCFLGFACAPVPFEPVDPGDDLEPVDTADSSPDTDKDSGGDSGATNDDTLPRLVLTVARLPGGRAASPDDCGAYGSFVGRTGGAVVCLGDGPGAVALLDKDRDGTPVSEWLRDAQHCPPGAAWVGGFSRAEACAWEHAMSLAYLREDIQGGGACPPEHTRIGSLGADQVCAGPLVADTIRLDRDRDGQIPRNLPDPGTVCPQRWRWVGWQGEGVVCQRPGPGTTIRIGMDREGRPWSVELEPEFCPPGWEHLGGVGYTAVCSSGNHDVVVLDESAGGLSTREIGQPGRVCPSGFQWAGNVGWNAVCVRERP